MTSEAATLGPHANFAIKNTGHRRGASGSLSAPAEVVEASPDGRFLRYATMLGRGACKRVYKAFDTVEGTEVAWNQVELVGLEMESEVKERLFGEIRTLQALKHRNIMSFYEWWYNESAQTINFVTEVFTSGTLRQYRKRVRAPISESVMKRWAWQILEGLVYLHGHDPPIVHRDLKCDNIFVNGTTGQIKIGDLGLATAQQGLSVVGTPEFMAPEIYEEKYDEKVDIYSFGMCLLELATLEYPYSECHGVAQIFRKVTQGVKPQALSRVRSNELRALIELCIAHDPDHRPQARQLLKHPFFESLRLEGGPGLLHSSLSSGAFLTAASHCGSMANLHASGSHAAVHAVPSHSHIVAITGPGGVPDHVAMQRAGLLPGGGGGSPHDDGSGAEGGPPGTRTPSTLQGPVSSHHYTLELLHEGTSGRLQGSMTHAHGSTRSLLTPHASVITGVAWDSETGAEEVAHAMAAGTAQRPGQAHLSFAFPVAGQGQGGSGRCSEGTNLGDSRHSSTSASGTLQGGWPPGAQQTWGGQAPNGGDAGVAGSRGSGTFSAPPPVELPATQPDRTSISSNVSDTPRDPAPTPASPWNHNRVADAGIRPVEPALVPGHVGAPASGPVVRTLQPPPSMLHTLFEVSPSGTPMNSPSATMLAHAAAVQLSAFAAAPQQNVPNSQPVCIRPPSTMSHAASAPAAAGSATAAGAASTLEPSPFAIYMPVGSPEKEVHHTSSGHLALQLSGRRSRLGLLEGSSAQRQGQMQSSQPQSPRQGQQPASPRRQQQQQRYVEVKSHPVAISLSIDSSGDLILSEDEGDWAPGYQLPRAASAATAPTQTAASQTAAQGIQQCMQAVGQAQSLGALKPPLPPHHRSGQLVHGVMHARVSDVPEGDNEGLSSSSEVNMQATSKCTSPRSPTRSSWALAAHATTAAMDVPHPGVRASAWHAVHEEGVGGWGDASPRGTTLPSSPALRAASAQWQHAQGQAGAAAQATTSQQQVLPLPVMPQQVQVPASAALSEQQPRGSMVQPRPQQQQALPNTFTHSILDAPLTGAPIRRGRFVIGEVETKEHVAARPAAPVPVASLQDAISTSCGASGPDSLQPAAPALTAPSNLHVTAPTAAVATVVTEASAGSPAPAVAAAAAAAFAQTQLPPALQPAGGMSAWVGDSLLPLSPPMSPTPALMRPPLSPRVPAISGLHTPPPSPGVGLLGAAMPPTPAGLLQLAGGVVAGGGYNNSGSLTRRSSSSTNTSFATRISLGGDTVGQLMPCISPEQYAKVRDMNHGRSSSDFEPRTINLATLNRATLEAAAVVEEKEEAEAFHDGCWYGGAGKEDSGDESDASSVEVIIPISALQDAAALDEEEEGEMRALAAAGTSFAAWRDFASCGVAGSLAAPGTRHGGAASAGGALDSSPGSGQAMGARGRLSSGMPRMLSIQPSCLAHTGPGPSAASMFGATASQARTAVPVLPSPSLLLRRNTASQRHSANPGDSHDTSPSHSSAHTIFGRNFSSLSGRTSLPATSLHPGSTPGHARSQTQASLGSPTAASVHGAPASPLASADASCVSTLSTNGMVRAESGASGCVPPAGDGCRTPALSTVSAPEAGAGGQVASGVAGGAADEGQRGSGGQGGAGQEGSVGDPGTGSVAQWPHHQHHATLSSDSKEEYARPIVGIIVRVKQCRGRGFYKHPLVVQKQSQKLKRSASL